MPVQAPDPVTTKAKELHSLAVVIPVFNEEGNLPVLHERLAAVFSRLDGWRGSFLFVDDHSSDQTPVVLRDLARRDPRVRWLRLSRNSGSHAACAAGLHACNADAALLMAADLQDPPELIPQLIDQHMQGAHTVWAVRSERKGESWLTRTASRAFYWLMNRLTNLHFPPKGADVVLVDGAVLDAFRQMPERSLSIFAAISWLGFRQASVPYIKQARLSGSSKWTLRKKLLLAVDSVVGYSYAPMRFMSLCGILAATAGLVWALAILGLKLLGVTQTVGYASLMIAILLLGGLQMLMLGVLGEYVWRVLEEARRRPRYFIEASSPLEENPTQVAPPPSTG